MGVRQLTNEQTNPAAYTALFANLAHAYGYAFVSAPATDLVTVQTSPIAFDPSQKVYPQYLSMGFPAFSVNSPAGVSDIQAQGLSQRQERIGGGTRAYPQSPLQVRCCCGLGGTVGVPAAVRSP